MICELSETWYKWLDGEAWSIGHMYVTSEYGGSAVTARGGLTALASLQPQTLVLMVEDFTRVVRFVPFGKLSVYDPNKKENSVGDSKAGL